MAKRMRKAFLTRTYENGKVGLVWDARKNPNGSWKARSSARMGPPLLLSPNEALSLYVDRVTRFPHSQYKIHWEEEYAEVCKKSRGGSSPLRDG